MKKNNVNVSVKDLKKGDYIYNEVTNNEGTFAYISIFKEINKEGKFCELVAASYTMPEGYEDDVDNLYYATNGVIPSYVRYASSNEIDYLNRLLADDDVHYEDGELITFGENNDNKLNQLKDDRTMAAPKINKAGSEEVIEVYLSETNHPIAFNAKVKELVEQSGMTEKEAKEYVRTTPFTIELYYHAGQGLFGVESEAVEPYGNEIYSPYTGEECDRTEVDEEE